MIRLCVFLLILCQCQTQKIDYSKLIVSLDAEVKSLDPRKATDANAMRIINLIFTSFVKIGPNLEILPDGASSWSYENLIYTFHLKDLKFSNGTPVTKEDILFSFKEFQKTRSPFYSAFKNIKSVTVEKKKSGFTAKVTMKNYSATFLSADLPIIKILPKSQILKSEKSFLDKPMGSGDFKLVHKNSRELLLERVSRKPDLHKYISFQVIRDGFLRTQKMIMGKIDISPSVIPLDKIHQFKKKNFKILSQPSLSTTYLLLNLKNNLLKQKKVRQSLSLAINQEEIIKYKMKGYGILAKTFMQPKSVFFNKTIQPEFYNLEKSQTLIQNLGLQGKTLRLSVSNNPNSISKAKILANQMSRSGLNVEIESYEWGTFYKDINHGNYDIALMKWVGVTDPDIYRVAFHSENQAPKGRNRSFYSNKSMDALLEKGLRQKNLEQRKKIYHKVQKIIADNIIVIPLWHDMEVAIIKSNITNYQVPINGSFDSLIKAKKMNLK